MTSATYRRAPNLAYFRKRIGAADYRTSARQSINFKSR
jgi:hypothetical protein